MIQDAVQPLSVGYLASFPLRLKPYYSKPLNHKIPKYLVLKESDIFWPRWGRKPPMYSYFASHGSFINKAFRKRIKIFLIQHSQIFTFQCTLVTHFLKESNFLNRCLSHEILATLPSLNAFLIERKARRNHRDFLITSSKGLAAFVKGYNLS